MDLNGLNAVVTGSSSGIGRAIAIALAQRGANVVIHGRTDSEALRTTAASIADTGKQVAVVTQDLSATTEIPSFVQSTIKALGSIDIWVNNAGADVLTGAAASWSFENKLRFLWEVDVAATLLLSKEIGGYFQRRFGDEQRGPGEFAIVNIGWDQAWQGMAGDSGEMFATIKGAVMSATKSLAQSLAPAARVNCVAPGWIQTAWGAQASDKWHQRARRESLMERWGSVTDVAAAVAFLASPSARFITGQVLPVNGGFRYGTDEQHQP